MYWCQRGLHDACRQHRCDGPPATVLGAHADDLTNTVELEDPRHLLLTMHKGGLGMTVINSSPGKAMAGQQGSGVVAGLRQVAHKG